MTAATSFGRLAVAALLALVVAACGVRGALVPPEGRDTLLGPDKDFPEPTGEPSPAATAPAPEAQRETPEESSRPRFPAPEAVN